MNLKMLLLLLSVVFMACGGTEEEEEILEMVALTANYEVRLWQTIPVEDGQFQFIINTTEELECSNSEIVAEFNINDSAASLSFDEPVINGACDMAPAILMKEIIVSATNVELPFNVNYLEALSTEGNIQISNSRAINIEIEDTPEVTFIDKSINKIPSGVAWGYLSHTEDEIGSIDDLYQAVIDVTIEFPIDLRYGYHGFFTIDPDMDIMEVHGIDDYGQAAILPVPSDLFWTKLGEVLKRLKDQDPTVEYQFTNSNGEEFRS